MSRNLAPAYSKQALVSPRGGYLSAWFKLISDTFNRPNSNVSLGVSDSGDVWQAIKGTWGIINNQAYNSGGVADAMAVIDSGNTNADVLVIWAIYTGDAGVLIRVVDQNNGYLLTNSGFFKKVAGVYTTISNPLASSAVTGDIIRIVASGSRFSVYRNGILMGVINDTSVIGGTMHGLRQDAATGARFDNFSIMYA